MSLRCRYIELKFFPPYLKLIIYTLHLIFWQIEFVTYAQRTHTKGQAQITQNEEKEERDGSRGSVSWPSAKGRRR